MWLSILQTSLIPRSLHPRPSTRDYNIWVDTFSGFGIGLLWNGSWDSWHTNNNWRGIPGEECDIGWLEAITVKLTICLIHTKGIQNTDVLIRSDNEGVIQAFCKGRSRNHMVNACIHWSESILSNFNLSITLIFVPLESNLADPISLSWGIYPHHSLRLSSPPSLPPEIMQ